MCGAIYESKYYNQYSHCNPPRYVIAFRGTLTTPENRKQDLILDFQFIRHNLHKCSRFDRALQAVLSIVATTCPGNVWLAGHSLGSAIALIVGRKMVSMNKSYLETYLFNPPFDSPPIERIKHEKIKDGIRIASSFLIAGLASMVHQHQEKTEEMNDDSFGTLCEWVPYLFLNRSDPISCEYIGYFAHREKMVQIGAGKIGQTATQNSVVSVVSDAIGKDYEAVHLIPSAYLTINLSHVSDIKQAHGIQQCMVL
ncbi:hypothetical protein Leryth_026774 [Lithospermum erythrorhizon]|nr:hypothetical protein Leryth_026774 [Lithospermum erythrorhizon]